MNASYDECIFLCQGGSGRSYLQAGGYLQSQLYGLSWQNQCGPGCCCSGGDGATGEMCPRQINEHEFPFIHNIWYYVSAETEMFLIKHFQIG